MSSNLATGMKHLIASMALLTEMYCGAAIAQPLDDVGLEFQENGVVATIRLTGPVQYQSHFPESHGKTLEIYYDRVKGAASDEVWVDNEVRKSPPSHLIPSFTVTTRDQSTKPRLVIEFAREAEYSVTAGKDNRTLLVTIRPNRQPVSTGALPFLPTIIPVAKTAATLTPEQANVAENNKQAHILMVQGRDALSAKNNEAAVEAFNKLLLLPPNDYTQDGQEWVGVARERSRQADRARIEYELYMRLYPDTEGAARVAQRLAGLSGHDADQGIVETSAEKKQQTRLLTYGSISSRYYFGKSKIESTQTFNQVPETISTSLTDQSMLITSVDASERYVSDDYDGRLVFRDVNTKNFLANKPSLNRVYAAYGEIKSRRQEYLLRVGRQSAYGGGVMGRFDGFAGSYGNAQNLRVNAVAGSLNDFSTGSKPVFAGASVDKGPVSVYAISQRLDGFTDRRAVGSEFRYFEDKKSAFALLDYDTYFRAVNTAQFMGTLGMPNYTLNFMVDHRKTPTLSIRNALNGATVTSVSALSLSASSLRDLALARTATTNMGQVGIMMPFREKWQVGGDFRLTNTTGLPAIGQTIDPSTGLPTCAGVVSTQGCAQANPGRGLEKSVTGQVIGSGIYKQGDIWSGSVTFSSGSANGQSFFIYNHNQFNSGLMMDASLQLSNYKDQYGGKTSQWMPMLRGSYRFRERFTFDVDGGYQKMNYSGSLSTSTVTRLFLSGGVRWDF